MTRLLSEFDAESIDFLAANRAVILDVFPVSEREAFEKLVQDYSFDLAQEQLMRALKNPL